MRRLVTSKSVLVCVGPGGVGKTTTAAALGVLAARHGRRTLVCTIEALYLAGHLRQAGTPLAGFVANRVLSPPGLVEAGALTAELARLPSLAGIPRDRIAAAANQLASLGTYLAHITEQQQRELDRLLAQAPGVPITRVPLQPHDVSNLDSLKAVADCFGAVA